MSVCVISPTTTIRTALSNLITGIGFEVSCAPHAATAAVVDLTSLRGELPKAPPLPSLALLGANAVDLVDAALAAGYLAVILPDDSETRLRQALTLLAAHAPQGAGTAEHAGEPDEALTERERQVMHLVMLGLTNKRIAQHLRITERTVKFHMGGVLRKHGATTRRDLMRRNRGAAAASLQGSGTLNRGRHPSS
jgi:two-component system, NarL family, nitrate/nitrite response regulator NarL